MKRLACLLLTGWLAACSSSGAYVNIGRTPVQFKAGDYPDVLKRWTRHYRIIRQFDTALDIHATLLSWEFRWAYTVALSRWYRLPEAEKMRMWARQQQDLDAAVEFIVAAVSSDNSWNDLEKGAPDPASAPGETVKRSLWRLTLEVDSAPPVLPMEIRVIEPISKLHRDMFPYIGFFHRLYLVRFPRTVEGREVLPETARVIRLRAASSLGAGGLKWETTNLFVNP